MMFRLMSEDLTTVSGTTDVDPICGVDFCDECGCCLDCFNECPCCPQAVVYADRLEEWMDRHGLEQNPFV